MTQEEYIKTRESMEKAEQSTRPFAIPGDDEIIVAGDANDTAVNKSNFKITFRIPKEIDGKIQYQYTDIEYTNVFITPRQDSRIVKMIVDLLPFYQKASDDGGIEKYDSMEILELLSSFPDAVYDRLYDLVASVLGVDERLKIFMTTDSVLTAFAQICEVFPEVVNEADAFFGQSSENATKK